MNASAIASARILASDGLLTKEELIAQIDIWIEAEDTPSYFLIEASLSGSKSIQDITNLLCQLDHQADIDNRVVKKRYFERLYAFYREDRFSLVDAIETLYRFSQKYEYMGKDEIATVCGFSYRVDMLDEGILMSRRKREALLGELIHDFECFLLCDE